VLRFLGHHNIRRSCLSAIIIDGLKISQEIRSEAAEDVRQLQIKNGITPGLAVLLVGDDPASAVYVRNKERACNEAGIYTETFRLDESITQEKIVALVVRAAMWGMRLMLHDFLRTWRFRWVVWMSL